MFEEKSQAASTFRPWFILNANESYENVAKICSFFEEEILEAKDNLQIRWGDDVIRSRLKVHLTMDSKLIALVTGLGGAQCLYCKANYAQMHNTKFIRKGRFVLFLIAQLFLMSKLSRF